MALLSFFYKPENKSPPHRLAGKGKVMLAQCGSRLRCEGVWDWPKGMINISSVRAANHSSNSQAGL